MVTRAPVEEAETTPTGAPPIRGGTAGLEVDGRHGDDAGVVPAAWAAAGETVAPTKTVIAVPAVTVVLVPAALGVKRWRQPWLADVFQPPVQLPIGSWSAPEARLVGSVNDSVTPLVAALVDCEGPAPASAIATVLFTPGVTLPN